MKREDEQLERLLKSAASAPKQSPGAAVFALEARVLGGWRGMARAEGGDFVLLAWFRRAAICGFILAMASLAWNFHERSNQTGAELAIASSAMTMGVEP